MIVEKCGKHAIKNNSLIDCIGLRKYIEEDSVSIVYPSYRHEKIDNNKVLNFVIRRSSPVEDSKYFKISMFYVNGIWYADRDDEGDYILKEVDKDYIEKR